MWHSSWNSTLIFITLPVNHMRLTYVLNYNLYKHGDLWLKGKEIPFPYTSPYSFLFQTFFCVLSMHLPHSIYPVFFTFHPLFSTVCLPSLSPFHFFSSLAPFPTLLNFPALFSKFPSPLFSPLPLPPSDNHFCAFPHSCYFLLFYSYAGVVCTQVSVISVPRHRIRAGARLPSALGRLYWRAPLELSSSILEDDREHFMLVVSLTGGTTRHEATPGAFKRPVQSGEEA